MHRTLQWLTLAGIAAGPVTGQSRVGEGLVIDASKQGEPISQLIYGQFIEHLGRCIYGGIWAEMLEDRKFFHPIGHEESPWRAEGPAGAVEMSPDAPYVGEHTPVIIGGAGIAHAGLGLQEGRRYVGRAVLAGDGGAGPVEVRLVWGDGPDDCDRAVIPSVTAALAKHPFAFTARESTDDGRLEITVGGTGSVRVGAVSLMPADNVDGMRADTLALLKELDAPIYRWPGGNFVSGYDWRAGIGDPDRRPPRKNPAWQGIEHNDFGIDEFMAFCRALGTEPYIVVNTGLGGAEMAVQELEYSNGPSYSRMGRLRAENGHEEPYGVVWWGLGNEMYGNWQLGHIPLTDYMGRNNEFADRLRAVDPSIRLVAVGAVGEWSEGMLADCADHMDALSEHFYCQENSEVAAHVRQIPDNVRRIAEAHRVYRESIAALRGKDIRIALDEWNYWYGPHVFGELGTRYFLKDALGVAAGLNEFARNSDIYVMANYAQTVNVIGCIKTTKTDAGLETTGLVLQAYRRHFGTIPVAVEGDGGGCDIAAAWTTDRSALTIAAVNPTPQPVSLPLDVRGATLSGAGTAWVIAGSDPMLYNDPGGEQPVCIEERSLAGVSDNLTVPPLSACIYRIEAEGR